MEVIFQPVRETDKNQLFLHYATEDQKVDLQQSWDCRSSTLSPDPTVTEKKISGFVGYNDMRGTWRERSVRKRFSKQLEDHFLKKVVKRQAAEYKVALEKAVGTYTFKIPFDEIVFPKFEKSKVLLSSWITYHYFRATWQGMHPKAWVVLAIPAGDRHRLFHYGDCKQEGYVKRTDSTAPTPFYDLRKGAFVAKTPYSKKLVASSKRNELRALGEDIRELEEKRKTLREEIIELEGQ